MQRNGWGKIISCILIWVLWGFSSLRVVAQIERVDTDKFYYTKDFKKATPESAYWIRVVTPGHPQNLKEYWDYTADKTLAAHGFIYEIDQEDGTRCVFHGVYEAFDSKGNLIEKGTYHEGEKNGKWYTYRADGKLLSIIPYNRNLRHGHCIWRVGEYYIQSMYSRGHQKDPLLVAFDDNGLAIDIDSVSYRPVLEEAGEPRQGDNKVKFFFKNGIVVGAKLFRYALYDSMPVVLHLYIDQYRPQELCATSAEVNFRVMDNRNTPQELQVVEQTFPDQRTIWNGVLSQIRNTMNQDYEAPLEINNENLQKLITYVTTNTVRVNHVTPQKVAFPWGQSLALSPNTPYYYTASFLCPEYGSLMLDVEIEGIVYSISFTEKDIHRLLDKPAVKSTTTTVTQPTSDQSNKAPEKKSPSVEKPKKATKKEEAASTQPKTKVEEPEKEDDRFATPVYTKGSIKSGASVVLAVMGRGTLGLMDLRKTATNIGDHAQEVLENYKDNLLFGGSLGFMGKHLFVGGGVDYINKDLIPAFAHVRFNLFNFLLTPFIDGKIGVNTKGKASGKEASGDLVTMIKSRPMYMSLGGGLRCRLSRSLVLNLEAAYSGMETLATDKAYLVDTNMTRNMGMYPNASVGIELNI